MKSAIFRRAAALIAAVITLSATSVPVISQEAPDTRSARIPRVVVSGREYDGQIRFVDGVTFVRLREFSERLGGNVSWNSTSQTARVRSTSLDMTAKIGDAYLTANGRKLWSAERIFIENGRTYVPLRSIGTAFGFGTSWDSASFSATMTRYRDAVEGYSSDDLYWLSRIIHAEARGESMQGKLAVGSVVMNRVKSAGFPGTVYGVIFDRNGGVQFTPVANGEIYKTPDADSIEAAKRCLDGERVSSTILFFINADIAESFWICANRRYVMTIGNHDFYA